MKSDYNRDIYRQLAEVLERLDKTDKRIKQQEEEHKAEIQRLKEEHKAEIQRLKEEIAHKDKIIAEKDGIIEKLKEEIERLKSQGATNSHNSSKPPSKDEPGAKKANEYNGRERSGKKRGGQEKREGRTLSGKDVEKMIASGQYTVREETTGNSKSRHYYIEYRLDMQCEYIITKIKHYVSESAHRLPPVTYGKQICALVVLLYSEGVVAIQRIASFIRSISNGLINIATGTVYNICRRFAKLCSKSISEIEDKLLNAKILYTDGTNVTVNGKQRYIRNCSTQDTVRYYFMPNKTIEELGKLTVLAKHCGTIVHDHETALYHFGTAHGECIAHLIRYLRKNTEDSGHKWSNEMIELLVKINKLRQEAINRGEKSFQADFYSKTEAEYAAILQHGKQENHSQKSVWKHNEECSLLNRLVKYKNSYLLFIKDFDVPFTNNLSERDLRKCKNRQKMSGGFRENSGCKMFCTILSVVETAKRRGLNLFSAISDIFLSNMVCSTGE